MFLALVTDQHQGLQMFRPCQHRNHFHSIISGVITAPIHHALSDSVHVCQYSIWKDDIYQTGDPGHTECYGDLCIWDAGSLALILAFIAPCVTISIYWSFRFFLEIQSCLHVTSILFTQGTWRLRNRPIHTDEKHTFDVILKGHKKQMSGGQPQIVKSQFTVSKALLSTKTHRSNLLPDSISWAFTSGFTECSQIWKGSRYYDTQKLAFADLWAFTNTFANSQTFRKGWSLNSHGRKRERRLKFSWTFSTKW